MGRYSARILATGILLLCATEVLGAVDPDSIINQYISRYTGERVRKESDIPIEVDQITLVVPSSDGHYFKISHDQEEGPDDYLLNFPSTARFMASYYDDDLLGGSSYRVPGLSGIFYDTGVYKKTNVTYTKPNSPNPIDMFVTVELTDILFAIAARGSDTPERNQDGDRSLCNYYPDTGTPQDNCKTASYASFMQTCSIRPNSTCTLDLDRVGTAPPPPPAPPADPPGRRRRLLNDPIPPPPAPPPGPPAPASGSYRQRRAGENNDLPPLPGYGLSSHPTEEECAGIVGYEARATGGTTGEGQNLGIPCTVITDYTFSDPHLCTLTLEGQEQTRAHSVLGYNCSANFNPLPTASPTSPCLYYDAMEISFNDQTCPDGTTVCSGTVARCCFLDLEYVCSDIYKSCPAPAGAFEPVVGLVYTPGTDPAEYTWNDEVVLGGYSPDPALPATDFTVEQLPPGCTNTYSPTISPTQFPTLPKDFICPPDVVIPDDTRYLDRRQHCEKVNVDTSDGYGLPNTQKQEACEAIIGCYWGSLESGEDKCRPIPDFPPAGNNDERLEILNQTGDLFIAGIAQVTIPPEYTLGTGPCTFKTFWGDKGLDLYYYPRDSAHNTQDFHRWPGSFFSTSIKVNPYPPLAPSPPPTPPMTDRYDLFFDYNNESNYTIRGTRGTPDISLASYTTPLFPAGEESWVAVSASPISTTRVDRTVVEVVGRNASNYTLTRTESVSIVKGTENLPTPEYVEDLRLVIVTDLGSEGAYELNKPMGIYQSIQFSDTYQGSEACAPISKGGNALPNQTCYDYRSGTPEVALTNESNTQTYCYSAFVLNVVTGRASERYYFNFTCPPETAEPTFAPTIAPTDPPTPNPASAPTSIAAGTDAFIDSEAEKAERSIVEIVVIFCGCLAALLTSIVFINTFFAAKKNNLDLRNIPEKEKNKVCAPQPVQSLARVKVGTQPPVRTPATFTLPSTKELKWI